MKNSPSLYPFVGCLLFCFLCWACTNQENSMGSASDEPMPELKVASGQIDRLPDFSSQWVGNRHVAVWLPESYNDSLAHAVLYMHDGQMLFDSSSTWNKQEWGVDEVASDLLAQNKVLPFIVVGIWNAGGGRHAEYFPQKPFESLKEKHNISSGTNKRNAQTALFEMAVQSDNYLRFLVTELKPYIDATYATQSDKAHTFIGGSSMGGLISMYALCEYPQVFGGAACMSTHWIGALETANNPIPSAFVAYLAANLPDPQKGGHKWYFDYGTATLDALYEPHQLRVDSVLRAKGFGADSWQSLKFEGADHSEKSWNKRLAIPLQFLLGKNEGHS